MSTKPTIYIVDDDALVLSSLDQLLTSASFNVRTFTRGPTFLEQKIKAYNACLLLDLRMPEQSGLDIQKVLRSRGCSIPIVFYSGEADIESTVKAMQEGAVTLLQKPVAINVLIDTLTRSISQYKIHAQSDAVFRAARQKISILSKREIVVANMVADGHSAAQIAAQLFISIRTVEAHKSNIFAKLDVNSTARLTQLVIRAESQNS